ncbi:MAG TPA: DUF2065 domain-containing protein [Steroidobacteraceae bacterium]|jgi:uncharacterized protein YjeT (DUF2065 family)
MNWADLAAAFALYLIIEGILPFAHPQAMKRVLASLIEFSDGQLRLWGLLSMAGGLALLFLVRS